MATWRREHPEVEIITRDRSNDCAQGSTQGVPEACRVADRRHRSGNWREAVQRMPERHPAQLRAAARRAAEAQVVQPANTLEPIHAES